MDWRAYFDMAGPVDEGVCFLLVWRGFGEEAQAEIFHRWIDMALRAARLAKSVPEAGRLLQGYGRGGARIAQGKLVARGQAAIENLAEGGRWAMRSGGQGGYSNRGGPVGGTACRRGGSGSCMRHFSTLNEKKKAQNLRSEGEPAPRGARNLHGIPNAWDDYMRGVEQGWKKQTKTRKSWSRPGREPSGNRREMGVLLARDSEGDGGD